MKLRLLLVLISFGMQYKVMAIDAVNVSNLSFQSEAFISPDYRATPDKTFNYLQLQYKQTKEDSIWGLESKIAISTQDSILNTLNLSQAYLQVPQSFSFGRKKLLWSELDESWQLGATQPLYKVNALSPESQGLFGIFYHTDFSGNADLGGINVFVSDINIPDQGASYKIEDGKFVNANPWFARFKKQIEVNDQPSTPIKWNIAVPDTGSVVFKPSAATQVYLGKKDKDFFMQTSLQYKPSHQPLLAVDGGNTIRNQFEVNISPQIYYSTNAAVDMQYAARFENMRLTSGLNYLFSNPEPIKDLPANFTYQKYKAKHFISPFIKSELKNWRFILSYLQIEGEKDEVAGPIANEFANYIPAQWQLTNSSKVEVAYRNRQMQISMDYLQATNDDYEMSHAIASYTLNKEWLLNTELALVRAKKGANSSFETFQDNDYFVIGAGYVF